VNTILGYVYVLAAFAALLLVGQGMVYVLSFGRHENNAIYSLFKLLTSPVTKIVRRITPAKVADKHVPIVAFFLLFWVCLGFALYFGGVHKPGVR
jgi:uncharacterized protein YggT (Ycf19 family)